jgi:pimeloyl-ACP methyl ester carboxylesterase
MKLPLLAFLAVLFAVILYRSTIIALVITALLSRFGGLDSHFEPIPFENGEVEQIENLTITHHFIEVTETLRGEETNVTLHAIEAGNPDAEEVIVFSHGMSETARVWIPVMQEMSKLGDYRFISLDEKGHGASSKPYSIDIWPEKEEVGGNYTASMRGAEIVTMLDQLGVEEFNLVTSDLSSYMAAIWAGEWADRVRRFCKAQSTVGYHHASALPQSIAMLMFPRAFANILEMAPTTVPRLITGHNLLKFPALEGSMRSKEPVDWEIVEDMLREAQWEGQFRAWSAMYNAMESRGHHMKASMDAYREQYTFPVLIMQGKHDLAQPPEWFDGSHKMELVEKEGELSYLEERLGMYFEPVFTTDVPEEEREDATTFFPKSPYVDLVFLECGHFGHLEVPDQFSDELHKFFSVPVEGQEEGQQE